MFSFPRFLIRNMPVLCSVALLSSCLIDNSGDSDLPWWKKDSKEEKPKAEEGSQRRGKGGSGRPVRFDTANCFHNESLGCLEADIPPAPGVRIEGKEFFDVDDFRKRFYEELLQERIDKKEDATVVGDAAFGEKIDLQGTLLKDDLSFSWDWAHSVSNDSFANDMRLYLKGEKAASASHIWGAQCSVDDLPPGNYYARLQKPLKFHLIRTRVVEVMLDPSKPLPTFLPQGMSVERTDKAPALGGGTDKPTEPKPTKITVTRDYVFCARIFSDQNLQIEPNEATHIAFEDYKLLLEEKECEEAGFGKARISL